MNKSSEGHDPPETRFDVPDLSYLHQRSDELALRTRAVIENMAKISRRIHEAIAISDEHLRPRRPSPTADDQV